MSEPAIFLLLPALVLPQHFAVARRAREHACEHEQQIGQAIEVADRFGAHRFDARQRNDFAFRAPAHGACEMAARRGHAAAGQDEILERRQIGVEAVERGFEAVDVGCVDHRHARNAQLAAEIEQVVLDLGQGLAHRGGNRPAPSTMPIALLSSSTVP